MNGGKSRRGKLLHRIKYRNSIDPGLSANSRAELLRTFDITARKRRTVVEYLRRNVRKVRTSVGTVEPPPAVQGPPPTTTGAAIVEFCLACPTTTPMSRFQEKDIMARIAARGLERAHPGLVAAIMREAHREYVTVTHAAGVAMKVRLAGGGGERAQLAPYKYLGKTENYADFLHTRDRFRARYLLHHPLPKSIVNECIASLPYELFSLHTINGPLDVDEFRNKLTERVNESRQSLHEFYRKIHGLVERDNTSISSQCVANYLGACTGLLSVNISRTIAHSLLHVAEFTGSKELSPYLKLYASFNGKLTLQPNADDIISVYGEFLKQIVNIPEQFRVLDRNSPRSGRKILHLCLTDEFFNECFGKIAKNVRRKYEPILEFIAKLEENFVGIYAHIGSGGGCTVSIADLNFDKGCSEILHLKCYLGRVACIPDNEYFSIGQLVLIEYRQILCGKLTIIIANIFNELCAQHEWENNDICETFEMIYTRAIETPTTTEQVIEIGKYMAWVKSEYLDELRERAGVSLEKLAKLIQLGCLSEHHLVTNSKSINWLDDIVPILEQNSLNYEQLKFETEEKLQHIIEDINVEITNVFPSLVVLDEMDDIANVRTYLNSINIHMVKIREIDNKIFWINQEEISLSFPKSNYIEFEQLKNYVYPFYHLLKLCLDVQRNLSTWLDGQFELIEYEKTKGTIEKYREELLNTYKVYRGKLRQAQDENVSVRFKGTVDDPDMLNWPTPLKLCSKATKLVEDFEPSLQLVKIMCNEALMKRHWAEMSTVAGFDITPNAGTTLRKIMEIDLKSNIDDYQQISVCATKERQLLMNLHEMENEWHHVNFTLIDHRGLLTISHFDGVEALIDNHNIKVLNMLTSIFVKPYKAQVKQFHQKITHIQNTIIHLKRNQTKWIELSPIFSFKHISEQLADESELFDQIDAVFRQHVTNISIDPNVWKNFANLEMFANLLRCSQQFEIIDCGIRNYLNKIRNYFPRFYLLSHSQVLRIVSITENSRKINEYIGSIFDNITKLNFNENSDIVSFHGCNPINFPTTINTKNSNGCVEKWLKQVDEQIGCVVSQRIVNSFNEYRVVNYADWIRNWDYQVLSVVTQMNFTLTCHELINGNLDNSQEVLRNLEKAVEIVKSGNLTHFQRSSIKSLITLINHLNTILRKLSENKIAAGNHFEWLMQMKYYLKSGNCKIRVFDTEIEYGNEYFGNFEQLIITPATVKCYHILLGAYKYHLSGFCQGATAIGKTETVKSLAKMFGMKCAHFNCSEQLRCDVIADYLKGIAFCGCWLCLDEIEKIDALTASILSQHLSVVAAALKNNANSCRINGAEINLRRCFACFIKNTDKRTTEIPHNLKILLRTITMTRPDYQMIVEISLSSQGFKNAQTLSNKIITFQSLFEELIQSKFIKLNLTVIKEILIKCDEHFTRRENSNEETTIHQSIRTVILPMLSSVEKHLFYTVLNDLFPSINVDRQYGNYEGIKKICHKLNVDANDCLLMKISQLKEILQTHKGVTICGDCFIGKTTLIKVFIEYVSNSGENTDRETINPKTLTLDQLYGEIDSDSQQWRDGLITRCIRSFSNTENRNKFVIFDGPLDPIWTENLNGLLDGNGKLCLISGETIHLSESIKFIFEVNDLNNASPAIINRCGLLFLESELTSWKPLVKSISKSEWSKDHNCLIISLFDWLVPPCLEFINTTCQQLCATSNFSSVKNMMVIIQMLMDDATFDNSGRKEDENKNIVTWIQASFIQGGIWGLAAALSQNCKVKFDEFYKQLWKCQNQFHPHPKALEKIDVSIPLEGTLYDYYYIYKLKGNWKLFQDRLKTEKPEECVYLTDCLIPTIENIKYSTFIKMYIKYNHPLLLMGPSSAGKTICVKDILIRQTDHKKFQISQINLATNSSANRFQDLILSKLNKRSHQRYGPVTGKVALIFIEDLHLPSPDEFGVTSVFELIRQYFDYNYWYDIRTIKQIFLDDINLIASATFQGNSQHLPRSFLRHFNILHFSDLSDENMSRIFSSNLFSKLRKIGFPNDVMATIHQIVGATIQLYRNVVLMLKPTVNRILYRFSVESLSKIFQNCAMIRKETADANKKVFQKFWTHEVLRTFNDRILDDSDRNCVFSMIETCTLEHFKDDLVQVFENLPRNEENRLEVKSLEKLMFGTYLDRNLKSKTFEEVTDIKQFHDLVLTTLNDYNQCNHSKLDLVLFEFALQHLSKICRVLTMIRSNLLLIGVNCSGRQSLMKLACHLYGQKLFQPEIIENYNSLMWRNDIKKVLKEAGGYGRHCTFFLNEDKLISEIFLDDIDNLIKTGEIPNLYSVDEAQEILDLVRQVNETNINIDVGVRSIFLYYQKLCNENIHIVLNLNLFGPKLRMRLLKYPSLIDHCSICCFTNWPKEGLEQVAISWIKDVNISDELKNKCALVFHYFHNNVITNSENLSTNNQIIHVTRASYLNSIKLFREQICLKQNQIIVIKQKYLAALEKLSFAAFQIAEMQKSLANYQPQLEQMTLQASEMTKQIAMETIEVEKASNLVKQDEKVANEQAAAAQLLKVDCEADLAQAIPILEDAISALNTLKPTDITLVKSMKNPPDAIKLVMAAVCVIKDVKPDRVPDPSTGRKILDYWGPSKRILGDMNFLQTLKDFDKDHIKPEIMVKIRKEYLSHKDFKPHTVAKASSAAEGLCKWIIAMDMYDKVAKEVAPKKEKLEMAELEYAATIAILNEKKEQVARIEEKLKDLNILLDEATKKQQKLQLNVDVCKKKLARAQKLITGLSDEKIRWDKTVDSLQSQFNNLPGDLLIFSGLIAHLGPFTNEIRRTIIEACHNFIKSLNIPCSEHFDSGNIFGEEIHCNGLIMDRYFQEGIIIQKLTKRWPIFIDPQHQANSWIKLIEKTNNLNVIKVGQGDYLNILRESIRLGHPILIENIGEHFDAILQPVIYKEFFMENSCLFINIGGKIINYNENFRLFITTTFRNPQYAPEVLSKINIINFILTKEALQDQMLTIITEAEKPIMKKLKDNVNTRKENNDLLLKSTEDKILKTLSESKTDILEDENSLQILDESKMLLKQIEENEREVSHLEEDLNAFKNSYLKVAQHSTVLYLCVFDLVRINYMYQFSLKWFIEFLIQSIKRAENFRDLSKRCNSIINTFTYDLYCNITRSIFEKDKLLFSFLLTSSILIFQGKINRGDLLFLSKPPTTTNNLKLNPAEDWLTAKCWSNICDTKNFASLEKFEQFFVENIPFWKSIYECDEPENCEFPIDWNNAFCKVLIISFLRPDRMCKAVVNFVQREMGEKFVEPSFFDISRSYAQSYILSPLLFILSPESDPVSGLRNFARTKHMANKLYFLSVGVDKATTHIDDGMLDGAQKMGHWVCLENLHLSSRWIGRLESKLDTINYENTHENFRLWLTAAPTTTKLTPRILENSVKIATDKPDTLKRNLQDLYRTSRISCCDFYAACPGNQELFSRLLFAMSQFHGVICQRAHFGPFGWNNPHYQFADVDFVICIKQLRDTINQDNADLFDELIYLIGDCNYGGYINNPWDHRILIAILSAYLIKLIGRKTNALPIKTDYQDYIDYIEQIPKFANAKTFGLDENYEMFRNLQESNMILEVLNGQSDVSINYSRILIIVDELLNVMPDEFDLIDNCPKYTDDDSIINRILIEEVKRYNNLLFVIKTSLVEMRNVSEGLSINRRNLDEMFAAFKADRVPKVWSTNSYAHPNNLSNYTVNLRKRVEFFQKFYQSDKHKQFWLGGFFHPTSFLAAVRIDHGRRTQRPLDKIAFKFTITERYTTDKPAEDDGIYVGGLFLIGAEWGRNGGLVELKPKTFVQKLPSILFQPSIARPPLLGDFCKFPLYDNLGDSSNFILEITLKTSHSSTDWCKRNVAAYCQINEIDGISLT